MADKLKVYDRIEKVLEVSRCPAAPHEFEAIEIQEPRGSGIFVTDGRQFVGCSESALGRRLREMRELGRVSSKRRDGEAFVEYWLPTNKAAERAADKAWTESSA